MSRPAPGQLHEATLVPISVGPGAMLSTVQLYRRIAMTAVGIDVGKAALDLAIDGVPGVVRFANSAAGIRKLVRRLANVGDVRVVVEATGGSEDALLEAC